MSFTLPGGSRKQSHSLWLLLLGAVLIFIPAFMLLRARDGTSNQIAEQKALSVEDFRKRGFPLYGDSLAKGLRSYARGDLAQSQKILEAARTDPSQTYRLAEVLYYLGRVQIESGKRADGEKHLLLVTNKHATSPYAGDAYGYFAKLARKEGDRTRLAKLYERIVERHPKSLAAIDALRHLAKLGAETKDLEGELKAVSGLLRCELPPAERKSYLTRAKTLAKTVIFTPRRTRAATYYTVKSGDTLGKIAHRFGVSAGFLRLINGKSNNTIYINEQLKILRGEFLVVVHKSLHELNLFFNKMYILRYRVGLGKEDRTPVGSFKIVTKLKNPAWYWQGRRIPAGDPRNLLGTRWLGFDNQPGASGFGIHGTKDPTSIGKNLSNGCVRMINPQVEELFELLPRGTRVDIVG